MLVDFKRPTSHIKYLSSFTSDEWIKLALSNPIDILIDHAHCERKAAGVAIQLMFRYPTEPNLAEVLSPIAREELEHFEKIIYFLKIFKSYVDHPAFLRFLTKKSFSLVRTSSLDFSNSFLISGFKSFLVSFRFIGFVLKNL